MNFVIKVADFGLAESVGTKEYFRQDESTTVKLPLRWLAPESLEDHTFSEKSDVVRCMEHTCTYYPTHVIVTMLYIVLLQWAYGVTCWEAFTGGKVPYASVTLTNLPRLLVSGHRLEKPVNDACNDEM